MMAANDLYFAFRLLAFRIIREKPKIRFNSAYWWEANRLLNSIIILIPSEINGIAFDRNHWNINYNDLMIYCGSNI